MFKIGDKIRFRADLGAAVKKEISEIKNGIGKEILEQKIVGVITDILGAKKDKLYTNFKNGTNIIVYDDEVELVKSGCARKIPVKGHPTTKIFSDNWKPGKLKKKNSKKVEKIPAAKPAKPKLYQTIYDGKFLTEEPDPETFLDGYENENELKKIKKIQRLRRNHEIGKFYGNNPSEIQKVEKVQEVPGFNLGKSAATPEELAEIEKYMEELNFPGGSNKISEKTFSEEKT